MSESIRPLVLILGFVGFWFVLVRWVFPLLGVKT